MHETLHGLLDLNNEDTSILLNVDIYTAVAAV